MRILVTTFPGEGHFQPMLPVIRAAERAGHELVVATGPDLAPVIERRGLTVWVVGPTMAQSFAPRPDLPPPPPGQEPFVTACTVVFAPAAEQLAEDLLPPAEQWRPDVVMSEVLEPAGLVVAARTGAHHVVHGLGPLPFPAHWHDVPALDRLCEQWGLPEPFGGLLSAPFLDICPPSLRVRDHAPTQRVLPLRPAPGDSDALAAATSPGGAAIASELDTALARLPFPQTVHLTLGTIFNKQHDTYAAALAGLSGLAVNVVVTVGEDVDPASLGPQPSHVMVARYLPHAALLPRCAALVSHGGAATMLAGYRHGLPQLFLPRGADQFDNAAAGVAAGAALSLTSATVEPEAVATATSRLLTEPDFRTAARRIQAEILEMPSADDVLAQVVAGVSAADG